MYPESRPEYSIVLKINSASSKGECDQGVHDLTALCEKYGDTCTNPWNKASRREILEIAADNLSKALELGMAECELSFRQIFFMSDCRCRNSCGDVA